MKKSLLLLSFLLLALFSKAQYPYPVYCVDSTMINIYYVCQSPYDPVCACNGKTYRNSCAADYWGGLVTSKSYNPGVCGNFDFDFVPNPIVPGVPNYNYGQLSIYSNYAQAQALIQIYDVYGRVWYVQQPTITGGPPAYELDVYVDFMPPGIYYMFVTINNESQHKKFMKANIH